MNDNMTRSKITKEIIADMPEELREDVRRYGDAIVNAYRRGCSDTEQKLSIASIGSKRNLEEDTVAVSETERGCLMCGLKYIPASDSEKGGEKGVCGGMYCVSSESLVNGKPCKEWCGDKHCWRA